MRERQLQYFIAVAEELHFGRAAERVHIQQPPLSRQIRALEEELGVELFKRTNRKVELTEAGRFFLSEARATLAHMEGARATLGAMASGVAGTLRVGFVDTIVTTQFASRAGRFVEQYPDVHLEFMEGSSPKQVRRLQEGTIHVGFLSLHFVDVMRSGLSIRLFVREPLFAALPVDHALAHSEQVCLEDLAAFPLISYPRYTNPHVYNARLQMFAQVGLSPTFGMEITSAQMAEAFVAAGFGWALMNESACRAGRTGIAYRRIADATPLLEIGMAWNPERETPLVRNFLDFMEKAEGPRT